jgi:hypothetical protein
MQKSAFWFLAAALCFAAALTGCATGPGAAAEGKVIKTLPQALDGKGLFALSPSLYERDAYQEYLRKHPLRRAGVILAVQWKARNVDWTKVKLRAEMRGVFGNVFNTTVLEIPLKKHRFHTGWAQFTIEGEDYKKFGELVAWRVTLLEGDKELGGQQSFMWTGVGENQ